MAWDGAWDKVPAVQVQAQGWSVIRNGEDRIENLRLDEAAAWVKYLMEKGRSCSVYAGESREVRETDGENYWENL